MVGSYFPYLENLESRVVLYYFCMYDQPSLED